MGSAMRSVARWNSRAACKSLEGKNERVYREWQSPLTVENPRKLHAQTNLTKSRSVYVVSLQLVADWRREWDSNFPAFNEICNLQILKDQRCRECQRCCGALHPIARGLSITQP